MIKFKLLFLAIVSNLFVFGQPSIPKKDELGKWFFYDSAFVKVLSITSIKIDSVGFFNEGLAPARDAKTKLWGYIGENGLWKIKPQYVSAGDMIDGFAVVFKTCMKNCCKSTEGLLSAEIGYVIDKSGIVKYTDSSQEEDFNARMFLQENLGKGLFTFQRAWSLGEKHSFMNSKGDVLGDDVMYYGLGGIYYEPALDAIKCGNMFYDLQGKLKLDLSKFQYISSYSEGYAWATLDIPVNDDSITSLRVLLDLQGKPIMNFDQGLFYSESAAKNGVVTFVSRAKDIRNSFTITTETFGTYEGTFIDESEANSSYTFGSELKNGLTPVYERQDYGDVLIGVKYKNGTIKLFVDVE
jgi:WG containing repeat